MLVTHPVLTCAESAAWEEKLLGGDEAKTWAAMTRAGEGVAEALLRDYLEIRPLPRNLRLLLLLGTGHNAGDALVAARKIAALHPGAHFTVLPVYPPEKLRPLARRALAEFEAAAKGRYEILLWNGASGMEGLARERFDICLEGVLGMQMKPPMRAPAEEVFQAVSRMSIDLRAAVDLPAGLGDDCADEGGFRADFTYATGITKKPVFEPKNIGKTGRVRSVDIGFFDGAKPEGVAGRAEILPLGNLAKLRALRPATGDKRTQGHVFIVGGSRAMPGAVCMATAAAIRAGAGLVTTFLPESLSPSLCATTPEAMWVPLPIEKGDVDGSLKAFRAIESRMTALVIGPGLDALDWNVRSLVGELVRTAKVPVVIDASALIEEALLALEERPEDFPKAVLTPHLGELARLVGDKVFQPGCDLGKVAAEFSKRRNCVTLLKGPVTRITDGERLLLGSFGGPTLARGGSGDILSGIMGALLSKPGADVLESAALAALWHGAAAEHLARERGQTAVHTTEILDHLSPAIREV